MIRVVRNIIVLSLFICALGVCSGVSRAYDRSTIDLEHRVKLFQEVWTLIRDQHYNQRFSGPEWERVRVRYLPRVMAARDNDEFFQVLRELAWETASSHTAFLPGSDGHEGDVGLLLKRASDRVLVTKVIAGSPASKAALRIGDEILYVGGISARSLHLNPVESELRGDEGSYVTILVRHQDGRLTSHRLERQPVDFDLPIEWKVLSSGFGYIRVYNFTNQARIDQFQQAYAHLKNAPGLIIDVRGPNGGSPSVVGNILGYFLDRVEMMTFKDRQGRGFKSYTVPQRQPYQGKVAVLIDERSRSGQEIFANTLQEHKRAVIVGTRSCGCVEGGNYVHLSDGEVLEIAHYAVFTPKSGNLEDSGVEPDRVVPITDKDITHGRDPQIQAAEQELSKQLFRVAKSGLAR
jgi:carboxyl-terminal processing protease